MLITSMTIKGEKCEVEIARTSSGALVKAGKRVICTISRRDDDEERFAKIREIAQAIYGLDRKGRVRATNSMIHDVWLEIDRLIG